MAPDAASSTDPLAGRLVALGRALRLHGIDAGPSELADAAAVITVLGLDDRERLRSGIAAATLHREGQRETFDQVFDIHFPAAVGARTGVPPLEPIARPRDGRAVRARAAALREQLVDAVHRLGAQPPDQPRPAAMADQQARDQVVRAQEIGLSLQVGDHRPRLVMG